MAGNIAEQAQAQANSLTQVNGAVREMDTMTQQNAAMAEQSTAAARSLATEASHLVALAARFRVDGAKPDVVVALSHAPLNTNDSAWASPARQDGYAAGGW